MDIINLSAEALGKLHSWLPRELDAAKAEDRNGSLAVAALLTLTGPLCISQPWALVPGSPTTVAWGAMILWLLLPRAAWIERHRRVKS